MLGDSQSEVAGRVFCTFFAAADIGKIVFESPQLKKQGIASYCEPKVQVSRSVHSGAADWIKEGCWHNTGMSSHPFDHTCDSAPTLVHASGWAELDGIIDQSIDPDLGLYESD
ncbi:unnamed protein product [Sphagnum balticum]